MIFQCENVGGLHDRPLFHLLTNRSLQSPQITLTSFVLLMIAPQQGQTHLILLDFVRGFGFSPVPFPALPTDDGNHEIRTFSGNCNILQFVVNDPLKHVLIALCQNPDISIMLVDNQTNQYQSSLLP